MIENECLNLPVTRPALFSPAECEQILALRYPQGMAAGVQRTDLSKGVDESIRKATGYAIEPIERNRWIWERIGPMFHDVNQRYYHFDLQNLSRFAVMEYDPGGFYDWHVDLGLGKYSCRKLSCVVLLSDPANYEGGRLIFGPGHHPMPRDQGAAIVFPSYLLHQVEPVASGLRHTLVCWALGDAFR